MGGLCRIEFGKLQGSGLIPWDLTKNVFQSGESDEVLIHLRSKFRVPDSPRFCYEYTLLDTGNKTNRTLMSEDLFRRFSPDGEINKSRLTINTAAQNSQLEVLGVPKDPVEITFYNNKDSLQQPIIYRVLPIIISNLQFPVLFSWKDMDRLDTVISLKDYTVTMETSKHASVFPLVGAPRPPAAVHLCKDVVIPPTSKMMVPVTVVGAKAGDEMQFEPDVNVILRDSVIMGCTIDELNDQKQMAVQMWNASNVPIRLKNNLRLGEAECLSTVMSYALESTAAYALQANSDLLKARPLTKWSDIKTREQLYTRLETDLGFDAKDHSLSVEQRKALVRAFADHRNALALDYDELGHVKGVKFRIPTGDAPPVKSKCRPLPPHLQTVLAEQIERWLAQKVIKPCDGPWAAPLVPTPKKNGGWRFAVDYRGLNAITQTDARPVANLEDQLAKVRNSPLKKMKYFASLDLSEAYHCVDVAEEDQPKTAMITPKGLYSFNKMAFGLKSAPQSFHQIVQMIEKSMHDADPELAKTVLLYFDDCLLVAEIFEELLAKLELFLDTLEKIGLKVQPRKCMFCKQRIKW